MLTPNEVTQKAIALLDIAVRYVDEGEPMVIDDELTPEEMSQLRSYLSTMRKGIDLVNKGLAVKWVDEDAGTYADKDAGTLWYVGKPKGKKVVDGDMFFQWLASKDADELSKLFNPNAVKVGGMSEAERSTHLDERPTAKDVTLLNKPL